MAEWFHAKVKFLRQMDNGLVKQVKEEYLVDAMSFTEAESRVTEECKDYKELTLDAIARSHIKEIVIYGDTDLWFKCRVEYRLMDDESEKESKVVTYLLINANDSKEAYERCQEHLKEMLVPFEIPKVEKTKIIEIYEYQKQAPKGFVKVTKEESPKESEANPTIGSLAHWFPPQIAESELWNVVKCAHKYNFVDFQQMMDIGLFNGDNQEDHREIYNEAKRIKIPETEISCAYSKSDQVGKRNKHPRSHDDGSGHPIIELPLVKPIDPTRGQAVEFGMNEPDYDSEEYKEGMRKAEEELDFDPDIEEDCSDLEERMENAFRNPNRPPSFDD